MVYCTSCGSEALADAVFCSKCGKSIIPSSSPAGPVQKRSKRWYLLPIFFDLIGGVICYYALKHDDKKLAQNCLKLGVILFLVNIAVGIAVAVYFEFQYEKNPDFQFGNFNSCPDCDNQITIAQDSGSSANASCVTENNCFSPNPLIISSGTTVTWKNTDTVSHTVTSGKVSDNNAGSMFDSGLVKDGGTFQFTFSNTGTYPYFCTVHPWMWGQVIVAH